MRAITLPRSVALLALVAVFLGACGAKPIEFSQPSPVTVETQQSLMDRWNAVATGVTVSAFGDFRWSAYDSFPHPTFKGGTDEAYSKFASIMVMFYQRDDNFEFLASHQLFTTPLRFGTAQTAVTSFEELTSLLTVSQAMGISDATRTTLKDFLARMQQ